MPKNLWTRDELILALNLYLKMPFGKMHKGNPDVIHLAKIIGRTADAVAIRLTNFASVDPFHQQRGIKGMTGGIRQVEPIWNEFINNKEELLFESERILAEKEHTTLETKYKDILANIKDLKGETKIREVKTRVNQNVFREIVIANYSGKCAVTGLDMPQLLLASHILPWSKDEKERLNPENGICFSPLYDRAFDKGLITISEKYEVIISKELGKKHKHDYFSSFFAPFDKVKIAVPRKYPPNKDFLRYHNDTIFKG